MFALDSHPQATLRGPHAAAADVVYELSPIEGSKGGYKILQYSLLYADTLPAVEATNRTSMWLQQAFVRLTELYPLSLGHVVQLPDRNTIVVSSDDRRKQRFFSYAEPDISVCEFDQIKHQRNKWPPALDALLDERTADTECLISAVVTRFGDGFLITLSVSHIITDAGGAVILLRQWGSLVARIRRAGDCAGIHADIPVDFDHAAFWAKLKKHPADVHPYVAYIAKQDYGSLETVRAKVGTLLATGSLAGSVGLGMRVLQVSGGGIAKLADKYNTGDSDKPLHGVQILYSLLWQRYVAAALCTRAAATGPEEAIFLNILHNMRARAGSEHYVGNGVSTVTVPSTLDLVLNQPIITLARTIKPFVNSVTPGAAVHLAEEIINPGSTFVLKAIYKSGVAESHMTISNASRLPFFEADFGLGSPLAVLWGGLPTEGLSLWLPNCSGGVDVHFGLKDDIYTALKADKLLSEFVHFAN